MKQKKKKKMMKGTSFAGGRGCLRKRNEKGLRNGRRRIFGNKLRRKGKRFSLFSYLEKTGSQLQTPKCRYGAILRKRRQKNATFKDDGCLFSLLEREKRTPLRKQERVTHFFVEHGNSSSPANVPIEVPVRVLVEIQEWNYAH